MILGLVKKSIEERKEESNPKPIHLTPNLKFGLKS
jgi:hypothetical protein